MKSAATRRVGRVAFWLALAPLGAFLAGWLVGTWTVQAQGRPTANPKAIQQTRERLEQRSAQQTPETTARQTQAGPRKPAKRRDPFRSLEVGPEDVAGKALPPGKRGLVIGQLSVDGIVVSPTELIVVVTMSGRNRAYFLREGDELYDGRVSQVTPDGVVFKQKAVDAFGKTYEKEVVKQISGSGA